MNEPAGTARRDQGLGATGGEYGTLTNRPGERHAGMTQVDRHGRRLVSDRKGKKSADMPGSAEGASRRGNMANADRSSRPSLPRPPRECGRPSLPGAPNLFGRSSPYSDPPLPIHHPPLPHIYCPTAPYQPCRHVVHSGYAYPSALLWADLP